jgi:hypothetical protein
LQLGFGLSTENLAMLFDTQALQKYGIEYADGLKCFEAFDTDKVRNACAVWYGCW